MRREDRGDHPREYGENTHSSAGGVFFMGSSPRIRGELMEFEGDSLDEGIIPANTGRIDQHHAYGRAVWDHPREYGENVSTF